MLVGAASASAAPVGEVTEFSLSSGSGPRGITAGPDGNLWFTGVRAAAESGGSLRRARSPSSRLNHRRQLPVGIAAGPDGNLWFTENLGEKIGRITATGTITEFPSRTSADSQPAWIAAGPDGNLWFTEAAGDRSAGSPIPVR